MLNTVAANEILEAVSQMKTGQRYLDRFRIDSVECLRRQVMCELRLCKLEKVPEKRHSF